MEENKYIDNLFKSAVEPYEMTPSSKVWSSLEAQLDSRQASGTGGLYLYISITANLLTACIIALSVITPGYFTPAATNMQQSSEIKVLTNANTEALMASTDNSVIARNYNEQSNNSNANTGSLSATHADKHSVSSGLTSSFNSNEGNSSGYSSDAEETGNIAGENSAECKDANALSGKASNNDKLAAEKPALTNSSEKNKTTSNTANSIETTTASIDAVGQDANIDVKSVARDARKHFSLDIYYSPQVANHSEARAGTENAETISGEKFGSSYNAGALLRYNLSDHWNLSLGCSYSTLSYSSSVTTTFVVPQGQTGGYPGGFPHPKDSNFTKGWQDQSYLDKYFNSLANGLQYNTSLGTINVHGEPVVIPATAKAGDHILFTTTSNMELRYVNVPLMAGYKLSHKQFDYFLDAGIEMNLLVSKQTTISIGDAYTETTKDITGLRNTSFSLIAGVGARYHLYKGISVFVEPVYRRAVIPITSGTSNGFYPYYFDLNTGLSLNF